VKNGADMDQFLSDFCTSTKGKYGHPGYDHVTVISGIETYKNKTQHLADGVSYIGGICKEK
jgi:hypothetical protein